MMSLTWMLASLFRWSHPLSTPHYSIMLKFPNVGRWSFSLLHSIFTIAIEKINWTGKDGGVAISPAAKISTSRFARKGTLKYICLHRLFFNVFDYKLRLLAPAWSFWRAYHDGGLEAQRPHADINQQWPAAAGPKRRRGEQGYQARTDKARAGGDRRTKIPGNLKILWRTKN